MATPRQVKFMIDLGDDPDHARGATFDQAKYTIDALIKVRDAKKKAAPVMTEPPAQKSTTDTKVIMQMLDLLPDGYFAWTPTDDAEITFVRVKRYAHTAKNKWAGTTLVSTQHSETLMPAWALWPSGRISRYRNARHNFDIEIVINGLIVDHRAAALRYARLKGNCCVCNKDLTDPRSRHYGIGPECEKSHGYLIAEVDESNDGKSYEMLVH
jgi:hypothetical protein